MSRVILLTRAFLKSNFSSENSTKRKEKKGWEYANIIAIIFAFIVFTASIAAMLFGIYDFLEPIQQTGLLVALGYNVYALMVFIFGIMSVITVFYFAKDVEYVLPMPFKPWEISLAKFFSVLIYEYIVGLFVMAPVTIAFGVKSGAGIGFYLVSIFCFVTIPILPLIYSSLISMILMRFTNISKHKDGFRIITGILAMVIALGVNFVVNSMTQKGFKDPQSIQKLLADGNNSLINTMSNLFITSKLGVFAAISNDIGKILINILLIIIISLIALAIFVVISNSFYLKGAVGATEGYGKKSKLSGKEMDKKIIKSSQLGTWVKKELIILFRTPAYLLNCVAIIILLPIILLFSLIAEGDGAATLEMIRGMMANKEMYSIILMAAFGGILFTCGTNPAASTSISREGEKVFISKFLPVSYKTQINAKIISSIILNGATVVILLICLIVFGAGVKILVMTLVLSILVLYFAGASGVLIDLSSPKLIWDNEQKAVKQNFNSLKSMLIAILLGAVTIIPVALLKVNTNIGFGIMFCIILVLDIVLYNLVNTLGVKLFKNLSD